MAKANKPMSYRSTQSYHSNDVYTSIATTLRDKIDDTANKIEDKYGRHKNIQIMLGFLDNPHGRMQCEYVNRDKKKLSKELLAAVNDIQYHIQVEFHLRQALKKQERKQAHFFIGQLETISPNLLHIILTKIHENERPKEDLELLFGKVHPNDRIDDWSVIIQVAWYLSRRSALFIEEDIDWED